MSNLKGKNIIVTGASGGIGNSIIKKLNKAGANEEEKVAYFTDCEVSQWEPDDCSQDCKPFPHPPSLERSINARSPCWAFVPAISSISTFL